MSSARSMRMSGMQITFNQEVTMKAKTGFLPKKQGRSLIKNRLILAGRTAWQRSYLHDYMKFARVRNEYRNLRLLEAYEVLCAMEHR